MKSIAQILGKEVLRELSLRIFLKTLIYPLKTGDRAILRAMHFLWRIREWQIRPGFEENRFADFLPTGQIRQQLMASAAELLVASNPKEQGIALALALTENFLKR